MLRITKFCQNLFLATKTNIAFKFTFLALVLLLSACGGGAENENKETVEADDGTRLTIILVNDSGGKIRNVNKGEQATVKAIVKSTAESTIVDFSAELATLDPETASVLTNDSDTAEITLIAGLVEGAGLLTASITAPNGQQIQAEYNYAVGGTSESPTPKASTDQTLTVSLKDEEGNEIRRLTSGGTANVAATLLDSEDAPISNQVVTFTTELATFSPLSALTDENGVAVTTITAGSELGAGVITALITVDNTEQKATYNYQVIDSIVDVPALTGSIKFDSASPQNIVLKRTGGAGSSEFSSVQFQVFGTNGLPAEGVPVNFSIVETSEIGGLSIDPVIAVSNSEGFVSTTVQAGSVPTVINIKASAIVLNGDGEEKQLEANSSSLIVARGRPDQNSFSLSLETLNPEAWDIDGVEVNVTARVADHYNNWVPDGTPVYFTTEGGSIEPSCLTVNSACAVKWVSQAPRPSDHRVTILATTLGGEGFVDTNSDGVYTIEDGEPYIDQLDNDIYDEPFNDANENSTFDEPFVATPNGVWDIGEDFVDVPNGVYDFGEEYTDLPDGKYSLGEEFTDLNDNGEWNVGEPFVDTIGNGFWNTGEPFNDVQNGVYDVGEAFTDLPSNDYKLGNIFIDYNRNGLYDGEGNNPDGETTYTERNRNTSYDGAGILPNGDSLPEGFDLNGDTVFTGPGYADLGEPFLDNNENHQYDFGEIYFDTNNDGQMNITGDGKMNSYLCQPGNNCSDQNVLHIRDSAVLVMSGSNPILVVRDVDEDLVYFSNDPQVRTNAPSVYIAGGGSRNLIAYVTDSAGQPMPFETQITVSSDVGKVSGTTSRKIANTNAQYYPQRLRSGAIHLFARYHIYFSITDSDLEKFEDGSIVISITTPGGLESSAPINVRS